MCVCLHTFPLLHPKVCVYVCMHCDYCILDFMSAPECLVDIVFWSLCLWLHACFFITCWCMSMRLYIFLRLCLSPFIFHLSPFTFRLSPFRSCVLPPLLWQLPWHTVIYVCASCAFHCECNVSPSLSHLAPLISRLSSFSVLWSLCSYVLLLLHPRFCMYVCIFAAVSWLRGRLYPFLALHPRDNAYVCMNLHNCILSPVWECWCIATYYVLGSVILFVIFDYCILKSACVLVCGFTT